MGHGGFGFREAARNNLAHIGRWGILVHGGGDSGDSFGNNVNW